MIEGRLESGDPYLIADSHNGIDANDIL